MPLKKSTPKSDLEKMTMVKKGAKMPVDTNSNSKKPKTKPKY